MKMDEISKSLGIDIPKGANEIVDTVGANIVKQFGEEKLREIAKLNFKNVEKIRELL